MHTSFNPGFPVLIYEPGMELPKTGIYYLVSGNGLWLHKDTETVRCFVKVDQISVLEDLQASEEVECKLPPLPVKETWRIKEFFSRVVEKHRAEACTVLYFNHEKQDWKIYVPSQQVSHGGVRYKRIATSHLEDMNGYLCVGTIHSHCDFGAFHSGTDIGDEREFDGLHVTFGHNDQDEFTVSASVVVNGFRTKVDPQTVLEGLMPAYKETQFSWDDTDAHWMFANPPEGEIKEEWSQGIDQWMEQVKSPPAVSWRSWLSPKRVPTCELAEQSTEEKKEDDSPICKDDMVIWAGDLATVQIRTLCGDGPFKVLAASDGKITISTAIGLAHYSESLFKKHKEQS